MPGRTRWLLLALGVVLAAAAAGRWRGLGSFLAFHPRPAATTAAPGAGPAAPTVAALCYFPSTEGFELVEEVRRVPAAASPQERVRDVVAELHRPPRAAGAQPLFPEGTSPRAVFLGADGTVYVDEPAAALDPPRGVREEVLLMRSLCRTLLKNSPEARAIVLLADGAARHHLALHLPAHGRYVLPARPTPGR